MIKNILITGSGGFIGKNLKNFFNSKYNLLTPRSYELDCVDEKEVKKYFGKNKIDFILHCASVGGVRGVEDKPETLDENVKMVENLLKYKNKDAGMILFSSGAMYDKSKSIQKIKEDCLENCNPPDLYGKSKKKIVELVKNRADFTCLTIFACYGYGEKESRFPTYAIIQNLQGKPIVINQNVVFDYLFIEDLCKIVEHFMNDKPKENVINVTPSESIDLKTISKIVNDISNYKSEIKIKNQELGNEYTGDNSRLLAEIPNFKFTKMEDGLKLLYDYLLKQIIEVTL